MVLEVASTKNIDFSLILHIFRIITPHANIFHSKHRRDIPIFSSLVCFELYLEHFYPRIFSSCASYFHSIVKHTQDILISVSQVIWGAKAPQRFFIFHSITVKRNQFFSSPMCSRQNFWQISPRNFIHSPYLWRRDNLKPSGVLKHPVW